MHFEPGWHHKSKIKRAKKKTDNDKVTKRPSGNEQQTTVNKQQTTDIRQSTVTDNANGPKRQRMQAADINKRPKKRTKSDSTDPEIPMNKTLHQYFSTDPGTPTSTKRGPYQE